MVVPETRGLTLTKPRPGAHYPSAFPRAARVLFTAPRLRATSQRKRGVDDPIAHFGRAIASAGNWRSATPWRRRLHRAGPARRRATAFDRQEGSGGCHLAAPAATRDWPGWAVFRRSPT